MSTKKIIRYIIQYTQHDYVDQIINSYETKQFYL